MKSLLTCGSCALVMSLAVVARAPAQATVDNTTYGGTSGEFLLLGAGARGTALGGAYAALATDVTSLYYNPGSLALMTRPGAMVSTYTYVAGTRYTWAGIAFPMSGGARALGLSIGTFGFSGQPVYTLDNPDGDGSTYSVSETFFGGSYAQNFSDRFSAGFSVKFISDKLASTSATGVALDFGTNFHASVGTRPIRGAFVIQNLGTNLKHSGAGLNNVGVLRAPPLGTVNVPQEPQPGSLQASSWSLPVLFRVGVALDLWNQGQNRVTVLSEFTQPNNNKPGVGGGVEYALSDIGHSGFSVAARASYTLQPANDLNVSGVNFTTTVHPSSITNYGAAAGGGIGYQRGNFRLGFDYAYKYLGALGGTDFVSFSLGW